jgi:5'-AMP-activated protein kinase regulatory beta subunit
MQTKILLVDVFLLPCQCVLSALPSLRPARPQKLPRKKRSPAMRRTDQRKTAKRRRILFSIDDPQAREVAVVGDFNTWDRASHPMKKDDNGLWRKIMMLPPGQYEYKFLVDGQWRTDPSNPRQCTNCYGTHNNILHVQDSRL